MLYIRSLPRFSFSAIEGSRKIGLSDEHMIGLVERPKETIARLLREQRRYMDDEAEETVDALPEQMDLFSDFYE